tara:strand:+ start:591 stop:1319 length:729 start_codon:yes stop_codon:yes gene_type:complete
MVNVDTVYQKVLALANKEQRGYITPQEFNLMADKAQLEIINDYFHGLKTAYQKPKNQTEASDEAGILREKMSFIRATKDVAIVTSTGTELTANLPVDVYAVATIFLKSSPMREISEVDRNRLLIMMSNPLTVPTVNRPVYFRKHNSTSFKIITIDIHPSTITDQSIVVDYWRKPKEPNWGYVVANAKPLYNYNTSCHFTLHPTEEENLVMRILQLAGIIIEKPQVTQAVMVDKQTTKQNQNS